MTRQIIESPEMNEIWRKMIPPVNPEHIVKLALGPKKAIGLLFDDWETMLAEIITGDSFGVDRMDYLLRDAYHAGVSYGKFDHFRLIETLRILPPAPAANVTDQLALPLEQEAEGESSTEPMLGLLVGGIHSAEALILARYFMYTQVYFHPVRLAYNFHLQEFLKEWLPGRKWPTDCEGHLAITDNEAIAEMRRVAFDLHAPGHIHARRIICREHFKQVYQRNEEDFSVNPEAGKLMENALVSVFGCENVIRSFYTDKGRPTEFPVRMKDGRSATSLSESDILRNLPALALDFIFVERTVRAKAMEWIEKNRTKILRN
jgi:HD superfamily phosphohydrolase